MRIRHCPAAVMHLFLVGASQNARQVSTRRGSILTSLRPLLAVQKAGLLSAPLLLAASIAVPAYAHHPFGMGDSTGLTAWQGLLSGIGHPLLGPDHLLFLLAVAFIGLRRPIKWVLPLLAVGLAGSAFSQFIPLPDAIAPWAEALVSLSLVIEGLMALALVPVQWLLPLIGLHGFLLGSTIVGAEPTPLATYFLGLLIAQGALLLLVTTASKEVINWLGEQGQRLGAGIWIGIGLAFAWVAIID